MRVCRPRLSRLLPGLALVTLLLLFTPSLHAQSAADLVTTVVAHERAAHVSKRLFLYTSYERSDRTGNHLWQETIAETPSGKLRLLVAEDGKSLSPQRHQEEIDRLHEIARDPASFIHHEEARKKDENRAQQMLDLLPRAYLFDKDPSSTPTLLRIRFRPNPAYVPQSYEERVFHGMSGTLAADTATLRLSQLTAHLDNDVTFGYGLLATIRAGSSFSTTRNAVAPGEWKTTSLDTHIDGKALFMKTISRNQQSNHKDFHLLPNDITIPQAIEMLTR